MTEVTERKVLAIDIGGTKIACALVSGPQLSSYEKFQTPRTGKGDDLVDVIACNVIKKYESNAPIVVATTGIVEGGCLTALNPSTLPIENNYPLTKRLEERLGRAAFALNDAQAATWGEFCFGAGKGVDNFAFITVSTGVGAGLVINGELLMGSTGLAGHVGHMTVSSSSEQCGCGRIGCLETVASGTAIARKARMILDPTADAPAVFELAVQGSPEADEIISDSAKAVAETITNLVASFDVERVALGGGVGLAPGFLERVRNYLIIQPKKFHRPIVSADTGDRAGLIGVAKFYESIFHHQDSI